MSAPKLIEELVEFFENNKENIKKNWNEAQTRIELINPLFIELGWDVNNERRRTGVFKDVIHEDALKIGKTTKAPDYSFNYGRKLFYLEAKKPGIDLKYDIIPSYQLRNYAWNAKLPISILTDFEELAIYDCRIKPNYKDNAGVARIKYYTYKDYIDKWDEIASLLSKDAVTSGSIDKFMDNIKKQKGTADVDDEFLVEIERWRKLLANNIAIRNPFLLQRELNYSVQKIIDRIIFLRICEDRDIENYGSLAKNIKSTNVYNNLLNLFRQADTKYNSGLFHFSKDKDCEDIPDLLTPYLKIDDKILKDIINNLYPPKSPYIFSVMPADILGSVYERFLGKVIKLTKTHRAQIEYKPQVKKAGGIYYTPSYIVKYIVKKTLGKLLEGKKPIEVNIIKVLDPACGSGSFLIEAFQYLIDWYLNYYLSDNAEKWKKGKSPKIFDCKAGTFLTIETKKNILLNNIFGVDIDSQAVEVTKLSLLLKVLETEGSEIQQQTLFKERVLPDLYKNIKCGNSLISTKYYNDQQKLFNDEEYHIKINAFDWEKEFKSIFDNGGFDVIIGNPPYVKEYTDKDPFEFKHGNLKNYYQGKMDLWYAFACHSIDMLKNNGLHSFIATNNWITNAGASILRNHLISNVKIENYIDFLDFKVFKTASIQTMIYIVKKEKVKKEYFFPYTYFKSEKILEIEVKSCLLNNQKSNKIKSFETSINPLDCKDKIITFINKDVNKIIKKIKENSNYKLSTDEVCAGIDVHQDFVNDNHLKVLKNIQKGNGIFVISDEELKKLKLNKDEKNIIKPYFTTNELGRYFGNDNNSFWIVYTNKKVRKEIKKYPNLKSHFDKYKKIITSDFGPYGLHRARDQKYFEGKKLIALRKTKNPSFTYTDFSCYVSQTYYIIKPSNINLKYLTGLLNSKIIYFWLYYKGKKQGNNLQVDKAPLLNLPIKYNENNNRITEIIKLVDKIIELKPKSKMAKDPNIKHILLKQIKMLEDKIDTYFFKIYELDDSDIKIIDNSLSF